MEKMFRVNLITAQGNMRHFNVEAQDIIEASNQVKSENRYYRGFRIREVVKR